MKILICADRKGYGEVYIGNIQLVTSDFINVKLLEELLTKLGYEVEFKEI